MNCDVCGDALDAGHVTETVPLAPYRCVSDKTAADLCEGESCLQAAIGVADERGWTGFITHPDKQSDVDEYYVPSS